jgi:hypothetical protein
MGLMEEVIRKKSGVINVAEFKRRAERPMKEKSCLRRKYQFIKAWPFIE